MHEHEIDEKAWMNARFDENKAEVGLYALKVENADNIVKVEAWIERNARKLEIGENEGSDARND